MKSDQALIERLCKEFQFPIEVVNTLIEYTLQQTNQQFSRNYVEKVAVHLISLLFAYRIYHLTQPFLPFYPFYFQEDFD